MIFSGNPENQLRYPILSSLVYDKEERLQAMMAWSGKAYGHRVHNIMFGGMVFSIFTSSHRSGLPSHLPDAALKMDGTSYIHKSDYRFMPKIPDALRDADNLWANRDR
jgi:hypothetical protein